MKCRTGQQIPVSNGRESRLLIPEGQPFDLAGTFSCGQAFRWAYDGRTWTGVVDGRAVRVRQQGRTLFLKGTSQKALARYLRLSLDITAVHASICHDQYIRGAVSRFGGTRILDQDPWECLISFICATNANIPVITRRIGLICERYGDPLPGGGAGFPGPDALSRLCEDDLRSCSAGYRAGYLCRTAKMVADDPCWADAILGEEYSEAHRMLMAYPGIGAKAADCVLLFGFGKYEAFPVDVWMKRVMERYPGAPPVGNTLTPASYRRLGEFARGYFGRYAGYAQQYLFMAAREDAGAGVRSRSPSSTGRPSVPS